MESCGVCGEDEATAKSSRFKGLELEFGTGCSLPKPKIDVVRGYARETAGVCVPCAGVLKDLKNRFFVGVGGKSSHCPGSSVWSSPSKLNKLDFRLCPKLTWWKKSPLGLSWIPKGFPRIGPDGGPKGVDPNGVDGLPNDGRDPRRPLPNCGGYVAEL